MPNRTINLNADSGVTQIEVPGGTIILEVHEGGTDLRDMTCTKLAVITAWKGKFGPTTVDPNWGINVTLYPNPEPEVK